MKYGVKTIWVYTAADGKDFLEKHECEQYEKGEMVRRKKIDWVRKYYYDFDRNRDKWIDNCTEFKQFGGNHIRDNQFDTVICGDIFMRQRDGRTTIINLRTGRCGKAIQSNPKFFDSETGWAIAWARYRGDEVPDYI
jgi:hypothetical protein